MLAEHCLDAASEKAFRFDALIGLECCQREDFAVIAAHAADGLW
jgi:hypothetical protein